MKKLNILFLGAGRRVSLAERFLAASKKLGLDTTIYSYEIEKDVPISSVSKVIVGKKWKDATIEQDILNIIDRYKINIVIPLMDEATIVLSKMKNDFKQNKNVLFLVSSYNLCLCFYDKRASTELFKSLNINTPEERRKKFPLIIKKIHGFGSREMKIVYNNYELDLFSRGKDMNQYMWQPFIKGKEYTVDSYVSLEGSIISIVPRRRLAVRSGEVSVSITKRHNKIIRLTKKILNIGGFIGPICLQFIEEKPSKKIYIIEINPRFGGGVINSIEAGVDFPLYVMKEYLNEKISPFSPYKENLKMVRADREFFICK